MSSVVDFQIEVSGKLAVLDRLLKQLYEEGHRVVLFSQFTMMLDIFEDMLRLRGYQGARAALPAHTPGGARQGWYVRMRS